MDTNTPPVTVAIIRKVRAGCEVQFEAALHEFIQRSLNEPGQLGVHVLRPSAGSGSREYGILRRFTDTAARDKFYNSAVFREWHEMISPLTEGKPRYEHVSGLETWFTLPGQRAIVPPPRWKMALVTLLGVYPASLLLGVTVGRWVKTWPMPISSLIIGALMVILLTWFFMPLLARLLKHWFYPETKTPRRQP